MMGEERQIEREVNCPFCDCQTQFIIEFDSPLPNENIFSLDPSEYHRFLSFCPQCELYLNNHNYVNMLQQTYHDSYKENSYGKDVELKFDKIMNLPEDQSSNRQRVNFLNDFIHNMDHAISRVLDVGSGMGVFCAAMKECGYQMYAIDVDPNLVEHMKTRVGIHGFCGEFLTINHKDMGLGKNKFDLICFNKVLEHVPVKIAFEMLAHADSMLNEEGFIYIELPDGIGAASDDINYKRQEFFLEHFAIYSKRAVEILSENCNYQLLYCESIREVNDKYTVRAVLKKSGGEE